MKTNIYLEYYIPKTSDQKQLTKLSTTVTGTRGTRSSLSASQRRVRAPAFKNLEQTSRCRRRWESVWNKTSSTVA